MATTMECHHRDCKACGMQRVQHSLLEDFADGKTTYIWRCENCGTRTPKQMQKPHVRKPGFTPAQEKSIALIKERLLEKHYGDSSPMYEMKEFDVKDEGWFASVVAETGMKGDEGTAASILCRRRVHVAVGRCGGLEVLNAKIQHRRRGWFAVWHGQVEC